MTVTPGGDRADGAQTPPPRDDARRRRERPMWGCVKAMAWIAAAIVVVLILIVTFGGYWYVGTENFAERVRVRIEQDLERRLGRDVTIGQVVVTRGLVSKVILRDVRIANAEGGIRPYFARVREVELTTRDLRSLLQRIVEIDRVDIRDPILHFEVFPEELALEHNFPQFRSSPPGRRILRVDISKMFVTGGAFEMLDRRHEIRAMLTGLAAEVTPTISEQIYEGFATAPSLVVQIQDYQPFTVDMRGGFLYRPGSLALNSIAMRGRDLQLFVNGKLDPLTEAVYDLRVTGRTELARIKQIFEVQETLDGPLAFDGRLRGEKGEFVYDAAFRSERIDAADYSLADVEGRTRITNEQIRAEVTRATYGGGSISADYVLAKYAEPYPMEVDLRYRRISIEKLFADWGVENTGLRGAATGELRYEWNKDRILDGNGSGTARLEPGAVAFGSARYPIPLRGSTEFALDSGVITFAQSTLSTPRSSIAFRGSLAIENLVTNLSVAIDSRDFGELDRIGFNFARAAGRNDYEVLGLGGSGKVTGTVRGPIERPQVIARIAGSDTAYNDVDLGESSIDLRYDGERGNLIFESARFREGDATLTLRGTIGFPERGPSPTFDLAIDANGWDVQRALRVVELELAANGAATGSLTVSGTGDAGTVRFGGLRIARGESSLNLNGSIAWLPGEGNLDFDLDVGADRFPVADIAAFLDFAELPVRGALTGTLHLEGPKAALEGAGSVMIRDGSIYGEPFEVASGDLLFTSGSLDATNLTVTFPAGTVTGTARTRFADESFEFNLRSDSIDVSRLEIAKAIRPFFSGRLRIESSGSGTFEQPNLRVVATVAEGTINGVAVPQGSEPPIFTLAIQDGRISLEASAYDALDISGSGVLATDGTVDGSVRIRFADVARALQLLRPGLAVDVAGSLTMDLELGGRINPIGALEIRGTVPELQVSVSDHPIVAAQPIRFAFRNGSLVFESFALLSEGAEFSVAGSVGVVGDRSIDLTIRGLLEAGLLQLFMPELHAEGHLNVRASISGTTTAPRINGVAELLDAEFRVPGFPQLIDDVTGTIEFAGDSIRIDSLRASLGGGTVVAGGTINVEGMELRRVSLNLQGTDVTLRYFEGVSVDGDFNLRASGDADRILLTGDVVVDRALYYRDFDFASSILNLILERRGLLPEVSASWQDRIALDVHLSANETLAVRNNIADITGSAEIDLTGTLANPIVLGEVEIDEGGRVRFQDVDYEVVRGTITFQNPFRIDPYFDITAEGRREEYDLTINLTGTLDRITPTITSDPPTSDLTLLTLLGAGGVAQNGGLGNTSLQAAGTSLLAQSVGGLIGQRILPFADSFRLDLGGVEGSTTPEPKITFEKRISDDIRVIVFFNTARDQNIEVIEWEVTPDWLVQFTSDSEKRESFLINAVDARFRRRYEGYWGTDTEEQAPARSRGVVSATAPNPAPLPAPGADPSIAADEAVGRPVSAVFFRADSPFDTSGLQDLVSVRAGSPLVLSDVRNSIEGLFATGDFRDIRVEAAQRGLDVEVTFALSVNYRVGDISFEGADNAQETRFERELVVREGDVLSLNAVDRSAQAVQRVLVRRGYLEATVDPETRFDRDRNRAEVIFHVTRGPRAKVATVSIEGETAPFTVDQVLEPMRLDPGDDFAIADARRDADRIRNFLVRKGHRRADVRFLGETYDAATDSVALRYRVNTGPKVRVEVSGVERRDVRRWIPFDRSEAYSEDTVLRAAETIQREYQRRGYFFASAEVTERMDEGEWVVTYEIDPGRRFEVGSIDFDGNTVISDKRLRQVVASGPVGRFTGFVATLLRRPTGVTTENLSDDRDALAAFYQLEGFTEAQISPAEVTESGDRLAIVFPIVEGPQTLLADVIVEGAEQVSRRDLPELLAVEGEPLNPQVIAADTIQLRTFYAERGNVEVQVSPKIDYSGDKRSAVVTYRIAEGTSFSIDDVVVKGNSYTERDVILRKADLEEGKPFNFVDLLRAQRELYRLGIFQRVEILPEQSGTATSERDVTIEVEEGKNLTLGGSIGYDTVEGFGVSVSASHRNLFGTGRYLGIEGRTSERVQRYFLSYREPFLMNFNVPTQVTVFRSDETNERDLKIQRLGTYIEASRVLREQTRFSLRYEYKLVDVDCPSNLAPLCTGQIPIPDLPREDQRTRISSVTPTYFWDRRNDPIDPSRGFFSSASLEYAFPLFSAETEFLKLFTQGAWYRPLSDRTLVAISARLGLIQPFGGSGGNALVPFSERFTGGGETSHRAFDLDQLGSLGDTLVCIDGTDVFADRCPAGASILALGGNALTVINAEYRFPLFGDLRGAVFVDAGNVFREIEGIDVGDFRYGVGVGARYVTPIGPLRFDLGYKLDREPYEDPFATFLSLGYAF